MTQTTHEYVVFGVLDLLLADAPPSVSAMALRLGIDRDTVESKLSHLEGKGLVNSGRLTMSGLAAASSLRAARRFATCAA